MAEQEAHGSSTDLATAFDNAGKDGHDKWGKGEHRAKARIEVVLKENPGSVKEYIVILNKN